MPVRPAAAADAGSGGRVEVLVRGGDPLDGLGAAGVTVLGIPVVPGADGARAVAGDAVARRLGVDVPALLQRHEADGHAGDVLAVPLASANVRTLLAVGLGDLSPPALRKAGAALARRADHGEALALPLPTGADALGAAATALVEGVVLAAYRFRVPGAEPRKTLSRLDLVTDDTLDRAAVERAGAVACATLLARDLTNTPSFDKSPQWLAEQASSLATKAGLQLRVRDERDLAAEGFGGILAVGIGSTRPPRLLELSYRPRARGRHVVLVGKGITFDSGGLSLKPNDGMVSMKTDMAGGAAVLAAMTALGTLDVPDRVTALIPAAENLPSGTAQRPGDVIRHYGGRTTEVLNTDAEGRLVLADALAYATRRLHPDVVVDLATLTGAATQGLGRRHAALYATDDELAAELAAAGATAGELVWRMPLVEDYRSALDSEVADATNIARGRRFSGGSILGALFLREFVGSCRWAHLDISGPARAEADEDEVTKGATGYGARLLLRWLEPKR